MRRDTCWWLLVAVILLPMSGSMVDTAVMGAAAEPNAVDPNAPAAPGAPWILWLGTIVTAAYALIRAIVWATPTPRDDRILTQVQMIVRALAKIGGLDVKQGVQQKKS